MKDSGANNFRAKNEPDLPVTANASGLSKLVGRIDNEISAALRSMPDDDSPSEGNEERESIGRHICVEVGEKRIAFLLTGVLEAGELQVVQPLPLLPDWLTGITAIRGEIISVVNLGRFFDIKSKGSADARPYLVVQGDEIKTAIMVDRILGTFSLYRLQTDKLTNASGEMLPATYLTGWACYQEGEVEMKVSLFNLNHFLSSNRFLNLVPHNHAG